MRYIFLRALCLGALVAAGVAAKAQEIIGPYSYQNAGKLLNQSDFASVHQRANLWAPYIDRHIGLHAAEPCSTAYPQNGRFSDHLDAVIVIDLPPDAIMSEEWLWYGLQRFVVEDLVHELCPNAVSTVFEVYIRGWVSTLSGSPYEVGQYGPGRNTGSYDKGYQTDRVSFEDTTFGLGAEYMSWPVVKVSFVFPGRVTHERVRKTTQLIKTHFPGTELFSQDIDPDQLSWFNYRDGDGSFVGLVEGRQRAEAKNRAAAEEFEQLMIARDVATARAMNTPNAGTYSLAWALDRMVEKWPGLAVRWTNRSSRVPCHFGNPDPRCSSLADQSVAAIVMLP